MAIQIQIKVLPNPSGEVVKVSAGGMELVGGTDRDTTTVELSPEGKLEVTGKIEERVVVNPEQMAATKVPVHDVDGRRSFEKEKAEAKRLGDREERKQKRELNKKWREGEKQEDERLGRQPSPEEQKRRQEEEEQERKEEEEDRKSETAQEKQEREAKEKEAEDRAKGRASAGSGAHVAGNVRGSKEVRDETATSKPSR
jgi:hypothetical protein